MIEKQTWQLRIVGLSILYVFPNFKDFPWVIFHPYSKYEILTTDMYRLDWLLPTWRNLGFSWRKVTSGKLHNGVWICREAAVSSLTFSEVKRLPINRSVVLNIQSWKVIVCLKLSVNCIYSFWGSTLIGAIYCQ